MAGQNYSFFGHKAMPGTTKQTPQYLWSKANCLSYHESKRTESSPGNVRDMNVLYHGDEPRLSRTYPLSMTHPGQHNSYAPMRIQLKKLDICGQGPFIVITDAVVW